MNSNDPRTPWSRLVSAARLVRDDRDVAAPYGFSTRVAALAFSSERRITSVFDRFALRALGVACLLAIASVAINYSSLLHKPTPVEEQAGADDPMSELLDV